MFFALFQPLLKKSLNDEAEKGNAHLTNDDNYLLIAAKIVTTWGPLYTCLVLFLIFDNQLFHQEIKAYP